MDAELKLLADASLRVGAAEEALDEGALQAVRESADAADVALEDLRRLWTAMTVGQRAVVGPAARDVRERLDAVVRRLPRATALTEIAPVADPEHDLEPEAA